jgi:hypothetical protein
VEPSHRIDAEEFYRMHDGVVIDDAKASTTSSKNGKTSTTTIAPAAASAGKHPTSGYANEPRPRCNQ